MIEFGNSAKVSFDFVIELIRGMPFTCKPAGLQSFTVAPGDTVQADFVVNGGPAGSTIELVISAIKQSLPLSVLPAHTFG